MTDTQLPVCLCPSCGYAFDRAGSMAAADTAPPVPGDLIICLNCGTVMTFTADLNLKLISNEALAAFLAEDPAGGRELLMAKLFIVRRGPIERTGTHQ